MDLVEIEVPIGSHLLQKCIDERIQLIVPYESSTSSAVYWLSDANVNIKQKRRLEFLVELNIVALNFKLATTC
jgi:hypothetical protein